MQTCNYNCNNRKHRHMLYKLYNYVHNLLMLLLNKHNYITILEAHMQTRNELPKPAIITRMNDTVLHI